jgi:GNAT superfamily N-acetyltransferase
MPERVLAVNYQSPIVGHLSVGRLLPDEATVWFAGDYLKLEAAAYGHELEVIDSGTGVLEPGTFQAYLQPDNKSEVRSHLHSVDAQMSDGDQYWYIRAGKDNVLSPPEGSSVKSGQVIALAFVRHPTTEQWIIERNTKDKKPYCGIDDVLVHPDMQRRGLGSALVHAVLSGAGLKDDSSINIASFEDAPATAGFVEDYLGLVAVNNTSTYHFPSGQTLLKTRFSTMGRLNVKSLRKRLEMRKPWLRYASLKIDSDDTLPTPES